MDSSFVWCLVESKSVLCIVSMHRAKKAAHKTSFLCIYQPSTARNKGNARVWRNIHMTVLSLSYDTRVGTWGESTALCKAHFEKLINYTRWILVLPEPAQHGRAVKERRAHATWGGGIKLNLLICSPWADHRFTLRHFLFNKSFSFNERHSYQNVMFRVINTCH